MDSHVRFFHGQEKYKKGGQILMGCHKSRGEKYQKPATSSPEAAPYVNKASERKKRKPLPELGGGWVGGVVCPREGWPAHRLAE